MGDGRSRRHAHAHTNEQTKQNETDNETDSKCPMHVQRQSMKVGKASGYWPISLDRKACARAYVYACRIISHHIEASGSAHGAASTCPNLVANSGRVTKSESLAQRPFSASLLEGSTQRKLTS